MPACRLHPVAIRPVIWHAFSTFTMMLKMEKIHTYYSKARLLFLCLALGSFTLAAGPFEEVVGALKGGNVTTLSKYFDNMVEIAMPNNTNSYSKTQAAIILKDFFARNPVKDFKLIHQGTSGEGSTFGIGNLETGNGNYRTTFFFRQKGNSTVLQELRFENK